MEVRDIKDLSGLHLEGVPQPDKFEFHGADGVFIKQIHLARAGYCAPQHAHTYDHTSMLATGSLRLFCDGVLAGDYVAPTGIHIPANAKHEMVALEDNTTFYCIHNTHGFPPELLEQKLVSAVNDWGKPK